MSGDEVKAQKRRSHSFTRILDKWKENDSPGSRSSQSSPRSSGGIELAIQLSEENQAEQQQQQQKKRRERRESRDYTNEFVEIKLLISEQSKKLSALEAIVMRPVTEEAEKAVYAMLDGGAVVECGDSTKEDERPWACSDCTLL
jgi:hypothetical protein